jgi:hypothetical protein
MRRLAVGGVLGMLVVIPAAATAATQLTPSMTGTSTTATPAPRASSPATPLTPSMTGTSTATRPLAPTTPTTGRTQTMTTPPTRPAQPRPGPRKPVAPRPRPAKPSSPSPKPPTKPATVVSGPLGPSFSFALPGAAPLGVPNFFIDSFRIPPFLLPIYQAAGIEYDVPWQVLAAINEIETDYGRNLSTSSAGAVGWMQFLPSTWKTWGVDATGSGYADPYNPVDAIFAAARYLHAAGASKNLNQAIFAYNHADWYVLSVLLRA